ncbi:ArnT family glycosyltransferase [Candidatus Margulisiibacteriota bacterium]
MFGDPGYCILEFPIYQAMTAVLWHAFSPSAMYGRLLSIFFTILSSIFLYLLAKKLFDYRIAAFSILFFLFSPLILSYSRTVMLEPMVIVLFLSSLYLYLTWLDNNKSFFWILATITSTIFVLVKPPYMLILMPVIFAYKFNKEDILTKRCLPLYFSFFVQGIFLLLWQYHTHVTTSLYPHNFSFAAASFSWYFGKAGQWLNPNTYFFILRRIFERITGIMGAIFLILPLWGWKQLPATIKTWLIASIVYIVIFINLNFVHDYYQLIIIPMIAIFMAIGFEKILNLVHSKKNLFLFIIIFMIAYYNSSIALEFFKQKDVLINRTETIKQYCPPRSNAAYFGCDLDPNLPDYHYLSNTKGLNIQLTSKHLSQEDILALNKRDNIRYFIFLGKSPQNIGSVFKQLKGSLLYMQKDELIIFKINNQ